MEALQLTDLARELQAEAAQASSGRAARTIVGGSGQRLRQTLLAMVEGRELAEHESPGEATLHVVTGAVQLRAGGDAQRVAAGELLVIPSSRHSVHALEDTVFLLTVVANQS